VGGDEFCVILADADGLRAGAVANRIFADLGSQTIQVSIRASASGSLSFASGLDATARLAAADKALYEAKRSGANRVAHAALVDAASAASPNSPRQVAAVEGASKPQTNDAIGVSSYERTDRPIALRRPGQRVVGFAQRAPFRRRRCGSGRLIRIHSIRPIYVEWHGDQGSSL
jgi:Diguanylate cyclase, GGDEF domain